MIEKIDTAEIKRLQALNPETVKLDEINRVISLIGWSLLEKLPDTHGDESEGKDIEHDSHCLGVSRVARHGCGHPTETVVSELLLVGMVNPLTKTPKENAKRNESSRPSGIGRHNPCAVQQENECSGDDQNLVPVVQVQFRQRVIHFLHRFLG